MAGLVAAVVGVAACSSSSSGNANDSAASRSSSVSVGFVYTKSGTLDFSQAEQAFAAEMAQLSKQGGPKVKVVACNDQATADGAETCLTQLNSNKSIVAVAALTLEGGVYARSLKSTKLAYIPVLPISSDEVAYSALTVTSGTVGLISAAIEYLIKNEGLKKVTNISDPTNPAATADGYATTVAKAAGGEFVGGQLQLATGQSDYLPLISQAQSAGAQGVFLPVAQGDFQPILQAYKSGGATFKLSAALSSLDPQVIQAFQKANLDLIVTDPFGDPAGTSLDNVNFQKTMKAAGVAVSSFSQYGYAGAQLLDNVLKTKGNTTRSAVDTYLSNPNVKINGGPMFAQPVVKSLKSNPLYAAIGNTTEYVGVYHDGVYKSLTSKPLDIAQYYQK